MVEQMRARWSPPTPNICALNNGTEIKNATKGTTPVRGYHFKKTIKNAAEECVVKHIDSYRSILMDQDPKGRQLKFYKNLRKTGG